MRATKSAAYWAVVKSDLRGFLRRCFNTIHPHSQYLDNWHIDAMIYALERCIQGHTPRLIINLPPRQLKSFVTSVVLPAFLLGLDSTTKIICISYSDELAKSLSRDFKRIVESEWFRRLFPDISFTKTTENEVVTSSGGGRFATSVGGTLTGRGGDFIIIDDPIKPEAAQSEVARTTTNDWFRNTLLSRLDDKQKSVLIIVMQRLHVNDLTGFAGAGGEFHSLSFPAIATADETIPVGDGDVHHRAAGEALHPEREDLTTLRRIRDTMGPPNFAAQYQQKPEVPDGGLIKRKWFNIIHKMPPIRPEGSWYVSIDSALSTAETADYSAISLIYASDNGYHVMNAARGHWDYETLKGKVSTYIKRYGPDTTFIVEAAGSGISLIHALERAGLRCFRYYPKDGKTTRAAYALPIIHAGRVFIVDIPGKNDWVEPYINEIVTFPYGRFDDQVDSLVQFLPWAERRLNPGANYL